MADPHPPLPSQRRRSLKGIVRWLVRFAVRSAVVVAVIVGLGLIVAAIVYANRVRIVNRTLALLVEPFRVSVESIDFYPLGSVRISNLHLEPKAAPPGTRLASIPEAIVTYRIGELRATQRLDSIALKGVHLRLDDPILGAFANDAPPSADEAIEPIPTEPFLISRLALFTGILSVEDGSFDLDLSTAPRMQGKWEFKTEAIDFDETGLTRAPFSWLLHDVRLGPEGNLGHLATFSGTGRLSADLSRIEIAPVAVEGLQLALTPEILPPPRDGTQEGQADDPTLSSPAPAPKRTVSIESLAVKDAAVSLRGFTGDGTPLIPDLEFGTTFVLPTLRFADGAWSSDGPLSLVLSHPQAGSGGLPFFSAESLELSVESPAAIIGERRIASVQVHDADLLLTDETLARFLNRPPNDNPASEAGAPWIVERLDLGESSLLMKDLHIGDKPLPGLSTSLRGEFTDLRFGGGIRLRRAAIARPREDPAASSRSRPVVRAAALPRPFRDRGGLGRLRPGESRRKALGPRSRRPFHRRGARRLAERHRAGPRRPPSPRPTGLQSAPALRRRRSARRGFELRLRHGSESPVHLLRRDAASAIRRPRERRLLLPARPPRPRRPQPRESHREHDARHSRSPESRGRGRGRPRRSHRRRFHRRRSATDPAHRKGDDRRSHPHRGRRH
ncbi:MAG TPA: hypothetical protein PLA50_03295 [Bacteroidia bacterium]|nr:hypothetical protein [Bacteroidia bacterium]